MADRLSPLDVSFLYFEEATTPMHVGGVAVFQAPPEGFDHARLVQLIKERIAFVPRYRQRLRWVPGHLANPVWVDDEHFDVAYHVRRSALPRPGNDRQLHDLVARVQSQRLDRSRPLWEMYLVEGLSRKRFAVITKTHHAMVDGLAAVDIAQVILDTTRDPVDGDSRGEAWSAMVDSWQPAPEPSSVELVAGAIADTIRRPTAAIDNLRGGLSELRSTAGRVAGAAGGLFAAGVTVARPAPTSPLNVTIGEQRRYATVDTNLDDYRRVRKEHGGTVNDVVLACVAGALRTWLLGRGAPVSTHTTVRALVPVSIRNAESGGSGNRVSSYLVDLPVGEPSAVMRLHQVSYRMKAHKETGQAVGAEALAGLAGFAPPTMHALGARVASGMSKRWFNLVVTNVPGPQQPLYAGGARMLAAYPVVPLAKGQAVSVGLTSYDGGVYFGLNGDRNAMRDVDVLAHCISDALAELVATVR